MTTEQCENCGREIGTLETRQIFDGHVVCTGCWGKLMGEVSPANVTPIFYATPTPTRYQTRGVQTIQQTSKAWKGLMLIAAVICIVGTCFVVIGNQSKGDEGKAVLGTLALAGGLLLFIIARICAWWFHG